MQDNKMPETPASDDEEQQKEAKMALGGEHGKGPQFNLSEFMVNRKHLEKARLDIKRVKNIVVEMQGYVQEH